MTPVIKRAVIIGGGIGGLCAAIAMHRIGIDAGVYEQAPQLNAVGAGLMMWPNAIRAFRYLGVADAVLEAGGRIERGEIRTSAGTPLSEWNFAALEQPLVRRRCRSIALICTKSSFPRCPRGHFI